MLVFDRAGKIIRTIGSRGTGPGKLLVAVGDRGLAGAARSTSPTPATAGSCASRTLGTHLGSFGQFRAIRGVAVSPDGSPVYGADAATNRITVSTATGGDLAEIGGSGSKLGQLRSPARHRDRRGRQRVGRRPRQRPRAGVHARRHAGDRLRRARRSGPGSSSSRSGISVDCHGLVTVGDSDNNRVQQFQFGARGRLRGAAGGPEPAGPDPLQPARAAAAGARGDADAHDEPARHPPVPAAGELRPALQGRGSRQARAARREEAAVGRVELRPAVAAGRQDGDGAPAAERGGRADAAAGDGLAAGLVADVRVTATTTDSAPTVVTRRVNVTG